MMKFYFFVKGRGTYPSFGSNDIVFTFCSFFGLL